MKCYKKESSSQLEIGQVFYTKRFVLTIDRNLCKGCEICQLICPRDAITLKLVPKDPDGKALVPVVDIDENKCDFHGICVAACPFSAIKITQNDQVDMPVVRKDVFPVLIRDIEINSAKCEPECRKCEEKCPLGIISVTFDPLVAEEPSAAKADGGQTASVVRTVVGVRKDLCVACQVCWMVCPTDAIKVNKFFEGSIQINQTLCPDNCQDCLDVCPVDALYLDDDGKVAVNGLYCIYCGTCRNVCPQPEALDLKRTSVHHTPVESGAWNNALEKLTSTTGLKRELAAKRTGKAREAIKNLNQPR